MRFGTAGTSGLYWDNPATTLFFVITASSRMTVSGAGINVFGNVTPATDNTRDLGASATRWRDQYIAGNVKWGTAVGDPMIKRSGTGLQVRTATDSADAPLSASTVTGSGTVLAGSASALGWSGRTQLTAPGDGTLKIANNAGSGVTGLQFAASTYIQVGTGTPEGNVSAGVGSLFLRTDGGTGTSLYVKQGGGTGNTGWVAK